MWCIIVIMLLLLCYWNQGERGSTFNIKIYYYSLKRENSKWWNPESGAPSFILELKIQTRLDLRAEDHGAEPLQTISALWPISRATVFRGPRNFEPSRGIWVFAAEFEPRNTAGFTAEYRGIYRGIRLFAAGYRGIWRFSFEQLFFKQKMTSK